MGKCYFIDLSCKYSCFTTCVNCFDFVEIRVTKGFHISYISKCKGLIMGEPKF